MRRERLIQLVALCCTLAFLGGAAFFATGIAASIGRNRLVYTDRAEAGDPPQVALGIAMGAFRGLFVNFLWIRANDLKEAGKYFEAVDLSKTITRLQPRFPRVWQFHAWNLAYNISVATQTPQERWNWVQAGIHLLRDEGIPANPNDLNLHRELAWIHLHKIQGFMDDAHRHYKTEHAREWTIVLGAPPRLTIEQWSSPEDQTAAYIERWIRPIAEAPDTLDELYTQTPEAREFLAALKTIGYDLDQRFLEQIATFQSVLEASQATGVPPAGVEDDPLLRLMTDPKFGNAGKAVRAYARKRALVDRYHMEPARMLRYMDRFGPLDWRHPAAQALYWSTRGTEEALMRMTTVNEKDFDLINTDRLTIQAVQELFRTGSLTYDIINPEFYLALPNVAFIDKYKEVMFDLRERSKFDIGFEERKEKPDDDKPTVSTRPFTLYGAGYENFMRDAIRFLYRRGDRAGAERYQKELYESPALNTNNPALYEQLSLPLDEFVRREILESGTDPTDSRATNPTVATQEISGSLMAAYIHGLLAGNDKAFRNEFDYARLFHRVYQDTQMFKVWVSGPEGRMGFPPFEQFAGMILAQVIEAAGIPQGPEMYRRAPVDLQGRAYVYLERSRMKQALDSAGGDKQEGRPGFDIWFPEPPGVDQYRREIEAETPPEKGRTELK